VTSGQQYLQFFGSDTLKRLHGCAMAEHDRGAGSPCRGLAQPLRRPQIGFGNAQAPVVFVSPSPLDVAGASNLAFGDWVEHEAGLQHHMTSHTPHPYFQFARAVFKEARHRLGLPPSKHDVLELAFHTWAVRCATENPDRVTDAALNLCVDRHLQSLLAGLAPEVVIAMGGPVARHFWSQTGRSWDEWGPMSALHGQVLSASFGNRRAPVVISMHPYQKGVDLHPEVVGRALADHLRPQSLQPLELKAA
jgi:uracil-DNA glycosylase